MKQPRRSWALGVVTVLVLVALGLVLALAPTEQQRVPVRSSSTLPGVPDTSPTTPTTPSGTASPQASVAASSPATREPSSSDVSDFPACAEVTPGPRAVSCITSRRKRLVSLGGLRAPIKVRGAVIAVQAVDVLRLGDKTQVRLRGGLSLPRHSGGELGRDRFYLGYGRKRFRASASGTGLLAPREGRAYRFRVAFTVPASVLKAARAPGERMRFVFSPRGGSLAGLQPAGVVAFSLRGALVTSPNAALRRAPKADIA